MKNLQVGTLVRVGANLGRYIGPDDVCGAPFVLVRLFPLSAFCNVSVRHDELKAPSVRDRREYGAVADMECDGAPVPPVCGTCNPEDWAPSACEFVHNGRLYRAVRGLTETYHGPENRVLFFDVCAGRYVGTRSECATTEQIIAWWKEDGAPIGPADYLIVTRHPNGYRDGAHVVTVSVNLDGTRYVKGGGFGCSRDYNVRTDADAVRRLLSENAMTLVSIVPV